MVHPKKYLGQHFLTDPAIAERIVQLLPEDKDKVVIEIGPGKGVLTDFLTKRNFHKFLAIEIDPESVAYLHSRYPALKDKLIKDDFLKLSPDFFNDPQYFIIGNFPYNISSQIFFKVLDHKDKVASVVCMIQKEVADRIIAPPGSRTYGILSVLLQAYYVPKFEFSVKPGSFFPPPKVTSSVISLTRNETGQLSCDEYLFKRIIKTTFNQRRKTIRNSLKPILLTLSDEYDLLTKRPEQLGVSEFIKLTNWVEKRIKAL
jgi:16S rRNA (adenine1518-N6/adenine1519-N6)-dimethyltransferase